MEPAIDTKIVDLVRELYRTRRMPKRIAIILSLVSVSVTASVLGDAPERKVQDNVITSEHNPKVRIELPNS